jgi:hypothetical protein
VLPKRVLARFGVAARVLSAEFVRKINGPRFAAARLQQQKAFGQQALKR